MGVEANRYNTRMLQGKECVSTQGVVNCVASIARNCNALCSNKLRTLFK